MAAGFKMSRISIRCIDQRCCVEMSIVMMNKSGDRSALRGFQFVYLSLIYGRFQSSAVSFQKQPATPLF